MDGIETRLVLSRKASEKVTQPSTRSFWKLMQLSAGAPSVQMAPCTPTCTHYVFTVQPPRNGLKSTGVGVYGCACMFMCVCACSFFSSCSPANTINNTPSVIDRHWKNVGNHSQIYRTSNSIFLHVYVSRLGCSGELGMMLNEPDAHSSGIFCLHCATYEANGTDVESILP